MNVAIFIFVVALLAGLIFWLLRAEWRATNAMWSPFGPDGRLREDLFTPVDQGGQGFVQLGAMTEYDDPSYPENYR